MTENASSPETEAPRPVRVPNVSAGAKSGLSGEVIGANAIAAYDENQALATAGLGGDQSTDSETHSLEVPAGDLDSRVEWVAAGETQDERGDRADAVYAHERDSGEADDALMALGSRLTHAVYQTEPVPDDDPDDQSASPPLTIPEGVTTVPALLAWVHEPEAHDQQHDRATLVLVLERAKPEDEQRSTLVEPLAEEYPPPVTTVTTTEPSAPTEVQEAIASPPSPTLPGTTVVTGSAAVVDLGGTPT